jgi:hypothetical protein
MTRRFNALSLISTAVLAASCAAAVPIAHAGVFETEGKVPATVTGEQTEGEITGEEFKRNVITTVAGALKCNSVKFHGKFEGLTTDLAVTPTYEGCTLGGIEANVKANDCKYEFTARETVDPKSTDAIYTTLTIGCLKTPEKPFHKIIITIPETECEVGIFGGITNNEFVTENTTTAQPKADIDIRIDAEDMAYSVDGGNDCPNEPKDDIYLDGTYQGVVTLRAEGTEGVGPISLQVT